MLLSLLDDPGALRAVAAAVTSTPPTVPLREALAARGVPSSRGDGINLWVQVAEERRVLVTLAAQGVGAAPGSPFEVRPLAAAAKGRHRRRRVRTL